MRRRGVRTQLLWIVALALSSVACTTKLGIATLHDAFETDRDGRSVTLQVERVWIDEPQPPLPPPALWYLLVPGDDRRDFDAHSPTAHFTLSFLVENESDARWTVRRSEFSLNFVEGGRALAQSRLELGDQGSAGEDESGVLLTLHAGGATELRVPFAVTACAGLSRKALLGTVYRLEVVSPEGELLLSRQIELGEWNQIWQGTRIAVLATLTFLLWGALG